MNMHELAAESAELLPSREATGFINIAVPVNIAVAVSLHGDAIANAQQDVKLK